MQPQHKKLVVPGSSARPAPMREVHGNVIRVTQWQQIPPNTPVASVPVPGEDSTAQTISERAHNLHLAAFLAAALLVLAGRVLGLV